MSATPPPEPHALAERFWAENAVLLNSEGKLAFARRARDFFDASMRAGAAAPAERARDCERFLQAVLALHAGGAEGRDAAPDS